MSSCKNCGRKFIWACREQRDADGKRVWVALDPEPVPLGIVDLRPDNTAVFLGPTQDPHLTRYMPHDATCTGKSQHIRKRNLVTS